MYRLDGLNGNKIISSPRVPYLWHVLESNQCSGRQKLKAQLAHVWDVIWINQCKVHVSFSSLACGGSAQAAKAVSAVELPSRPTLPLVPFKNQLIQYIDSFFFFFQMPNMQQSILWRNEKKCIYDGCYPMRAELGTCCCAFCTSLKVIFASHYLCPSAELSRCSLLLPGSSPGSQFNHWWLQQERALTLERATFFSISLHW